MNIHYATARFKGMGQRERERARYNRALVLTALSLTCGGLILSVYVGLAYDTVACYDGLQHECRGDVKC